MKRDTSVIRKWNAPRASELCDTVEEFLDRLGGPTWIHVPGRDHSRTRVVTTLLHGNEPSGVRALHQWLRSEVPPVVDMVCFIGAVEAALAPPGFYHRFLPNGKDLNRCFREPFDENEGRLAKTLLEWLRVLGPEALVDLHNTSGRSPAYGVTTKVGLPQVSLISLFSEQLVQSDLRLGTLIEAIDEEWPTVVVECGGAYASESYKVAFDGLLRFVTEEDVLQHEEESRKVRVFQQPIRVELCEGRRVTYESSRNRAADLTLLPDVEKYNFECLQAGDMIGWVGMSLLDVLVARGDDGQEKTRELFLEDAGRLVMAKPARVFMMTTNPTIATKDCLFYVLPIDPAQA